MINYDTLLQNATDITKCDSYFIIKYDRNLLKNPSGFLLENATVITKSDVYYKLLQYTLLLLMLLNALFHTPFFILNFLFFNWPNSNWNFMACGLIKYNGFSISGNKSNETPYLMP